MRVLTHFTGTVRDFRRWLRQQKCQVVSLAECREKKKTAQGERPNRCVVTSIIAQRKRDCNRGQTSV
jgi:hypothetical protein